MRELGSAKREPFSPGGEQKRAHRGRLADAHRRHLGADKLHRVVDRQPRRDDAAWRIDVKRDLLLRIVRLEKEQLRDHQRSREVVDRPDHENDAFAQQPRENIERALAARRLLDDDRHEVIGVVVDGIAHGIFLSGESPQHANIGAPGRPEKGRPVPVANLPKPALQVRRARRADQAAPAAPIRPGAARLRSIRPATRPRPA